MLHIDKVKDLIYNPTQDLIDDNLLELVMDSNELKDVYRTQHERENFLKKEVDVEMTKKDDSGKKLHRAKTHAESVVNEKFRKEADEYEEATIRRKELELSIDTGNKLHYHATKKLESDRSIDVRVSQAGQQQF